jgi:isopentenyl-diphosphate delta-isomerase
MPDIEERKIQHINLAKDPESQINKDPFSEISIPYKALPEIDYKDINTSASLLNKRVNQPLIIASMTGGTKHAQTINTNLAIAAEQTKIAFGVGSQRIALDLIEAENSFKIVRKYAPTTVIFANMGAVQLNYGKTIEDYQKIVDMIEADALYLHINALQEALQPEGDTNFSSILRKIEELIKQVRVPVFAKEVGHGLDEWSINKLIEVGVNGIDVAGANGTSWAWIEAKRKGNELLAGWFKDYGISTEESLKNAQRFKDRVTIIASGGIRNPIQGFKALISGAHFYSAAKPFLEPALESPDRLIEVINTWKKGLETVLFTQGKTQLNKIN